MGFDVKGMRDDMLQGFRKLINTKGSVSVNDVASKILGGSEVSSLTTIFNHYANQDNDTNLSEAEFTNAIDSYDFAVILGNTRRRAEEQYAAAYDPTQEPTREQTVSENNVEKLGVVNSPGTPRDNVVANEGVVNSPGTPRDNVVANEGEYFANEVWDPMQRAANELLNYMKENGGKTDGFEFTGFPHDVKILNFFPMTNYTDSSNDVLKIENGEATVTRYGDSMQAVLLFEYNGKEYRICSQSTDDLTPWGNPTLEE